MVLPLKNTIFHHSIFLLSTHKGSSNPFWKEPTHLKIALVSKKGRSASMLPSLNRSTNVCTTYLVLHNSNEWRHNYRDALARAFSQLIKQLVSCPDLFFARYFSHAEGKNSLVNCLSNFCSKRHVRGAPIRLLTRMTSRTAVDRDQRWLGSWSAMNFLVFGSSEDDPCNKPSL